MGRAACLIVFLGLVLSACANTAALEPDGNALPLPDQLVSHGVAASGQLVLNGNQAAAHSPDATEDSSSLVLAAVDAPSWAVYSFAPGTGKVLSDLELLLVKSATDEAWFAAADWAANRWQFLGAYGAADQTIQLADPKYLSPSGEVLIALVVSPGHHAKVFGLKLTAADNSPATLKLTADETHGDPGAPVQLDAAQSTDPDGALVRYEWDLDGDGTYELDTAGVPTTATTLPDPEGQRTVRVRATDRWGGQSSAQLALMSCTEIGPINLDLPDSKTNVNLVLVDGHPAVACVGWHPNAQPTYPYQIEYRRALDAAGATWGPLRVVDISGDGYGVSGCSLAVIDGKPAITYVSTTDDGPSSYHVRYVRSGDADGDAWSTAQELYHGWGAWLTTLADINGRPAVCFTSSISGDPGDPGGAYVTYMRANDPDGGSWGSRQCLETTAGYDTALTLIGGKPAIAHRDWDVNNNLITRFLLAQDVAGGQWNAGVTVIPDYGGYLNGPALLEVDGRPAIVTDAYLPGDTSTATTVYLRANDALGTSWPAPVEICHSICGAGLALIGGLPVIAGGEGGNAYLYRAQDVDGQAWEAGEQIDLFNTNNPGSVGANAVAVLDLDGCPALAYQNSSRYLRYMRIH